MDEHEHIMEHIMEHRDEDVHQEKGLNSDEEVAYENYIDTLYSKKKNPKMKSYLIVTLILY